MFKEFFAEMSKCVPQDSRIMLCQFRGDPGADARGKWKARVIDDPAMANPNANVYLCVSAMRRNDRGEFRRRKDNFAGGLLLMIDDVGDGPAAKFPLSVLDALPPTALVETSPRNFQAVYMFSELVSRMAIFESLINAFIEKQFLGKDTGMAGVNRVFRPPFGVNGKPKHNGWRVRCADWQPQNRYSPEQIASAFGLSLVPPRRRLPRAATADKAERIRAFVAVRAALRSAGMLKRQDSDPSGWTNVRCPWTATHTGGIDNGAAIREPAEDNGWNGAFRCHHGSCADRGWRELTDWLAEEQAELLEMVNKHAR